MNAKIFLITLICAMLATVVSAQIKANHRGGDFDPNHTYLPGEWYKPVQTECTTCRPGFYPVNNIISPTQFGCKIEKCVKAGRRETTPKGVPEHKQDTVYVLLRDTVTITPPPVALPVQCCDTTIVNVTVIDTCCEQPRLKLHGVAASRWFGEVDLLRSTDHSFKSAFPVVRLGWQVEGYIKEAPGFKLQFETNLVGFQQNTDPGCTSCVPQDISKPNIGLQIKGTAKWQFSKKNSLSVYRKSTTVMLTKREAVALPDEGWGVELERKAGPVALHAGWIKNSSKANTIYLGISANAFEKSSGVKEDRGVYQIPDKLSSKRSEAREQRKSERKAAKEQKKAERKEAKKKADANKEKS